LVHHIQLWATARTLPMGVGVQCSQLVFFSSLLCRILLALGNESHRIDVLVYN
jgi:hypothetical protein